MNLSKYECMVPGRNTKIMCNNYCPEYLNTSSERNAILCVSDSYSFIRQLLNAHLGRLSDENGTNNKVFIITNDDPSVESCVATIQRNTDHAVKGYDGNLHPEDEGSFWKNELRHIKVLVMSIKTYQHTLVNGLLAANDAFLVVFEECVYPKNNAITADIINQIDIDEHHPRIIGLSKKLGVLLSENVRKMITDLEQRLRSKFVLCPKREDIMRYIRRNPQDKVVVYEEEKPSYYNDVKLWLDELIDMVTGFDYQHGNSSMFEEKLVSCLTELKDLILEGYLEGFIGVSLTWFNLWCLAYEFPSIKYKPMLENVLEVIIYIRRRIKADLTKIVREGNIFSMLSSRVRMLVNKMVDDSWESTQEKNKSCLICTKSQNTAIILYSIVKYLVKKDVLKYTVDMLHNQEVDGKRKFLQKHVLLEGWNIESLNRFHDHLINILIVSDEVQSETVINGCDVMISYDPPSTFETYMKRKNYGLEGLYSNFIFVEKTNLNELENQLYVFTEERKRTIRDLLSIGMDPNYHLENENDTRSNLLMSDNYITTSDIIEELERLLVLFPGDSYKPVHIQLNLIRIGDDVQCNLPLPPNYKYNKVIEGDVCSDIPAAKRNVLTKALTYIYEKEKKYQTDILNKDFRKLFYPDFLDDSDPNYVTDDLSYYDMLVPSCFENSHLQSDKVNFLHVIHFERNYPLPETLNELYIENFYASPNEIAFVTGSPLPVIPEFPVYTHYGEMTVKIKVNDIRVVLSEEEILRIKKFHTTMFIDLLQVVPCFMVQDNTPAGYRYLYVPVNLTGIPEIDWDTIDNCKIFPLEQPSDSDRLESDYSKTRYLGKVVTPWYRPEIAKRDYVVTDVIESMKPQDQFPGMEYNSFVEYMEDKYLTTVLIENQPLLKARSISTRLDCIDPRYDQTANRRKECKHRQFDDLLIPELCLLQTFPAVYWVKAIFLPAISFRLYYNMLAIDLHNRIIQDIELMEPKNDRIINKMKGNDSIKVGKDAIFRSPSNYDGVAMVSTTMEKLKRSEYSYPWKAELTPVDIERNITKIFRKQIILYLKFIKQPIINHQEPSLHLKRKRLMKFEIPELNILKTQSLVNVKLFEVLKATTTSEANDFFYNKRLKKKGQSILQFLSTVFPYIICPELGVIDLLKFRNQLLSTKYISRSASVRLNLESYVRVQPFNPPDFLILPGFHAPEKARKLVDMGVVDMDLMFMVKIPEEEKKSGVISKETCVTRLYSLLHNCVERGMEYNAVNNSKYCISSYLYGKQLVSDRMIANTSKALIAVLCEEFGMNSLLSISRAMGIFHDITSEQREMFDKNSYKHKEEAYKEIDPNFIPVRWKLERILSYRFQNSALLLEALTHSSFVRAKNEVASSSNDKLCLLGDSILYFLLTAYVHQECRKKDDDDVKDLIYALTSNVTYSFLSSKLGLHKFLLYNSFALSESIDKYLEMVKNRQSIVVWDLLYRLCDCETNAKVNTVPVALSDVFKSLIAAVYLDCGMDLKVVWNLCYSLMYEDIVELVKNKQRNPTSWLKEVNSKVEFKNCDANESNGKFSVIATLPSNVLPFKCVGYGNSKKEAKYAASKIVIAELNKRNE